MARIIFDLAAQTGDLHIHGAFLCLPAIAAQIFYQTRTRDRLAQAGRENPHQLHFGSCQAHRGVVAPHFAALHIIPYGPEAEHFWLGVLGGRCRHSSQDRIDPEQQFFGLKGFGEVIIGTGLEPCDPVIGAALGRQQQDRHGQIFAQRSCQADTIFAGHHHIQHDQIEIQPRQQAPRMGCVPCGRYDKPVPHQKFLDQGPDTFIIVNNQQVGVHVLWRQQRRIT